MKVQRRERCNLEALLASGGVPRTIVKFLAGQPIFSQGDVADSIMYLQKGCVKKSVFSSVRREAVIAMLGPGDFFGEASLAGHPIRMKTATAIAPSTVLVIDKGAMMWLLRAQPALADQFIAHLLRRNDRMQENLIDQLLNSAEQRLARTLLLLACQGKRGQPSTILPTISQGTLAGMVGTTRPRINLLLKRFKTLGFIDIDGLTVNRSLLREMLGD